MDDLLDLLGGVSTVDTGNRSDFDFYETPAFQTRSLLTFAPDIRGTTVLECASGRDAIVRVLRDEGGCTVFTNDLDLRHPAQQHLDATTDAFWRQAPPVDWVVTNPPFNQAFAMLIRAVLHARLGVAFLLRKTWSEPTKGRKGKKGKPGKPGRGLWLYNHTATREVRQPRYSYRGDGSDSCACDWMIWDRDGVTRKTWTDHLAETRTERLT